MTETRHKSLVEDAREIFGAAVKGVQAPKLIAKSEPKEWAPGAISAYEAVRVVGMGKAALAMAGVIERELGAAVRDGCVVVPERYPAAVPASVPRPETVEVVEGGHPVPTTGSVRGARQIGTQADAASAGELVLVLVSGGGTALSTHPGESLELADLKRTYHLLLRSGVEIQRMNAVRKHLTRLGGGQLARAAQPAHVSALILSDVVGDDFSVIASGPTVPDPSTYEDAMRVLYAQDLWTEVPAPVRTHLSDGARGRRPETPKSGADCFAHTTNTLIGANRTALAAAKEAALARDYEVRTVTGEVEGEARTVGKSHVRAMLRENQSQPTCWLWGGETTVTVTGDGTGGRNQEVALGAAFAMEEKDTPAVLLSGGTDGIDGPTDAAGAWATPQTTERARAADCDPKAHLRQNNAYPLFEAIGQLLRTGPTHTNVMDVHVGLTAPGAG
jgi:hydroxypyruvate reductase